MCKTGKSPDWELPPKPQLLKCQSDQDKLEEDCASKQKSDR